MRPFHIGSWLATGVLGASLSTIAAAADSDSLEVARKLNDAFVQVAETVSPSVVVIKVVTRHGARGFHIQLELPGTSFWEMVPQPFREFLTPERERRRPNRRRELPGDEPRFDAQGSGVVIRDDGYILTNFHVVEDAERIRVRFKDGTEYDAPVRGLDARSDLAVLKVDTKGTKLIAARLGDSNKVRVGEFAIAIGAPFELDYSVTFGHVSAKGRSRIVPDASMDQDFLQTDANINPGNSGGPLVNISGEVIGINTMIRGLRTGIGFAVPVNLAREVSDRLINDGKYTRAWLGVAIAALRNAPEYRDRVKTTHEGVVITYVLPDGPAARSELKAGDVITAVDGRPIAAETDLKAEVRRKPIGSPVKLDIVRVDGSKGERSLQIEVKPESWPEEPIATDREAPTGTTSTRLGLKVETLNRGLARQYGLRQRAAVVVTSVQAESEAGRKHLKPGDVITEVNQQRVRTADEFEEALKGADARKGVIVTLTRNGTSTFEVLKDSGD